MISVKSAVAASSNASSNASTNGASTVPARSVASDLSSYGVARSTIKGGPLSYEEMCKTHAFWRACNYLALGMIYLQDNPLLREPLRPEHIKNRMLGHWGASPALSFIYTHLNRSIKNHKLDMIFQPFYSTKLNRGGTGLGLSISSEIVRRHGGRLEATSQPGEGATFVVELPRITTP